MGCDKQLSYAMVITICSLSDHVPLFLFFARPQCAFNVICAVPNIDNCKCSFIQTKWTW